MKIEKCKICGSMAIWMNKIITGHGYYAECSECHWCAEKKLTKHGAWKEWNKEMRRIWKLPEMCGDCRKFGTDECPNSTLCDDFVCEQYFERK